jgi:Mannosyl-glycoprotein endo-beta-N-acetylglucosaminidase
VREKEFHMSYYYKPPPTRRVPLIYTVSVTAGIAFCVWFTVVTWPDNPVGALVKQYPIVQTIFPGQSVHAQHAPSSDPAHRASSSHRLVGQPSLSADFVNQVLARAHSPASGIGQTVYDLSRVYGIDDAYALAFFEHESSFGTTGVAKVSKSWGNSRCSTGYTCIDGFRAYASWELGCADWFGLLSTLYVKQWHLVTVEQIIPVYAPSSDGNSVAGYIAAVVAAVDRWRRGEV